MEGHTKQKLPNEFRLDGERYLYVDAEPLPYPGIGFHVLHDGSPIAYVFRAYDPQFEQVFFIHKPGNAQLTQMVDEGGLCALPGSSAELLLTGDIVTLYAPEMEDFELSDRVNISKEVLSAVTRHFNSPKEPQIESVGPRLSHFRRLVTATGLLFLQKASSGSK